MVFEPVNFAIGALAMLGLVLIIKIVLYGFKRKPQHDLHNFKKLVYDSGIKTMEVYKNLKELETAFNDIEKWKHY